MITTSGINAVSADPERIRMRADNVLVRLERAPERTRGGLVVPDQAREPRPIDGVFGRVLRVGPGRDAECSRCGVVRGHVEPRVQVGDLVVFDTDAAGDRWHIDGREYRVVREAEILAVLEDDAAS